MRYRLLAMSRQLLARTHSLHCFDQPCIQFLGLASMSRPVLALMIAKSSSTGPLAHPLNQMAELRLNAPESELQPGYLISGGNDQSTFFVTLVESCSASSSISPLGLVSLFRLKARPIRPNAMSKNPAIISQCGYSSARSICPHKASTAPLEKVGGSETVCWR